MLNVYRVEMCLGLNKNFSILESVVSAANEKDAINVAVKQAETMLNPNVEIAVNGAVFLYPEE
jgi:hypothetical protein